MRNTRAASDTTTWSVTTASPSVVLCRDSCPVQQPLDDQIGGLLRGHPNGVDANLRRRRGLVRAVDTGEVRERTRPRLLVEALDVALLGLHQRSVHEYFDELAGGYHVPH